ncbi:hypothetical protein CDES_10965 [Corynebacterium deserti GIMN1.010]|uniref:Uncharacterized protein n=1 Tax=Corynebacterium deserti GIMN1.010 TaxID=931089 RepID=A0A0M5IPK7_9CORY|nr:hypothetical protein CDES_10965 [Corynebacterium deserti GIMN1.010]
MGRPGTSKTFLRRLDGDVEKHFLGPLFTISYCLMWQAETAPHTGLYEQICGVKIDFQADSSPLPQHMAPHIVVDVVLLMDLWDATPRAVTRNLEETPHAPKKLQQT